MPRIRTWHRVAHDFNRDPEVRELRRRYGDWMALVWLEMLSWADRHDGIIKGGPHAIAESFGVTVYQAWSHRRNRSWCISVTLEAQKWMQSVHWLSGVCRQCVDRVSTVCEHNVDTCAGYRVCNYLKFREPYLKEGNVKKQKEISKVSLLDKTRLDKKRQDKDSCSERVPSSEPPEINPYVLKILEDCQHLKRLSKDIHRDFWDTFFAIVEPYELSTVWLNTTLRRWNQWFEDNPTRHSRKDEKLRSRLLGWLDKDLDQQARRK